MIKGNNAAGWNQSTANYYRSQKVVVQEYAFAYVATCIGDSPVLVNGQILFPSSAPATIMGDSITIGDPLGKLYKGDLTVSFPIATLGATPNVEIIQLYYLTDQTIKSA